jgi:hypothetical protein
VRLRICKGRIRPMKLDRDETEMNEAQNWVFRHSAAANRY